MKYGYARVSTDEQTHALQLDALKAAGCEKIITESASGAATRPKLDKLVSQLTEGDILAVWRLDRLGRDIDHLRQTINLLGEKSVGFQSLNETIDTTTANGELIFNLFASLTQFERRLLSERTKAGLDAAKKRGVRIGRPRSLTPAQCRQARKLLNGDESAKAVAASFGVSVSTLYRAIKPITLKG